jgi:hypothetical protein
MSSEKGNPKDDDSADIEALECPTCGSADVDFERRSETLVRCGLCGHFIEGAGTSHFAGLDNEDPKVRVLRGSAYSPTPPKKPGAT